MHVVVTGFDARATRPGPGHTRHSLAFLITQILEQHGHRVTQTTGWLDELEIAAIYDSADVILVGLASPLGLASTYAYPAMLVLNEYWEDPRLRLFCDDPDTGKVVHGATSSVKRFATQNPLFSNRTFRNRKFFEEAAEDRSTEMYAACERLCWPGDWPLTYFPVQTRWASPRTTQIGKSVYYARGLDPTNVLLDLLPPVQTVSQAHRSGAWLMEPLNDAKWARKVVTLGAKLPVSAKPSLQRLYAYPHATGVLESPALSTGVPGWWTPAATIAVATGTFFHTDIDPRTDPDLVRSPYYTPLPTLFESLAADAREPIVRAQANELVQSAPTTDQFVKEIVS
jgi:hypothetical protein